MKKLWKGACALVLTAFGVLAAAPGCVEAEAPFFIIGALVPSCDALTVDSPVLLGGRMDLRYTCSYNAVLLLGNQLIRRGDDATLKVETARISITGFDVQLLDAAENPIQRADGSTAEFSVPSNGFVDAARAGQPGEGFATALLIDGATAQELGNRLLDDTSENDITTVIARITGRGRTLGGDDVKTRPWDFPIDITYNSLCYCTLDEESTDTCAILQDQSFHCSALGGSCKRTGCVAGP